LRVCRPGAAPLLRRVVLTAVVAASGAASASAQTNLFNAEGSPGARGTYGSFPYEQVDPLSGNLIISVTDLSLPGPIPLSVTRTYNSKFHRDFEHGDQSVDEWSPVGVGWRLHFGRVLHAAETTPGTTIVEASDGGGGALYQTSNPLFPEGWITKAFVRYDRGNHTAKFPNGLIYTFGHIGEPSGPRGQVRYVTAIADQYGNSVTFSYGAAPGRVTNAHQVLSGSQWRDVNFVYNGDGTLATITYGGRTWTFQYDAAGGPGNHYVLRRVLSPIGSPWEYQYTSGLGPELTAMIAPAGGRIDYTYATVGRQSGPTLVQWSRVVAARQESGPRVTQGTWTFAYSGGPNSDTTTVSCACGTVSYRYNGIGISGNFNAWISGTLAERRVLNTNGAVVEQETFTYDPSEAISTNTVTGEIGQWADQAVYLSLLRQRTLTRSSTSWTTVFDYRSGLGNYNDFGRAWRVTETGDLTRITRLTFKYGFTPWIIGGTESAELEIGGTSITTGTTSYNLSTGFVTGTTRLGVATSYAPNANGTVASVTNANGRTTQLTYNWGVLSGAQAPLLTATNTVNPDGSLASAQVGPNVSLATTYEYDPAGRPTYIRPPGANFLRFVYNDSAGNPFIRVERGSGATTAYLDGFGRTMETHDSLGVKQRVSRDACGRVSYASRTYTTGDGSGRGTTTTYDPLGRVATVSATDPSGSPAVTTYTYTGADVSIVDAAGRSTSYDYSSFGRPEDARLIGLLDANGQTTTYQYDVFGHLTQVNGPGSGAQPRTWSYHPTNGRLQSDTQPERGTTLYTYDTLGNLKTLTDAANRVTTFTYDQNERLTERNTAGDSTSRLQIFYDTSGRIFERRIQGVVTTFTYDSANRRATRSDAIDPGWTLGSSYSYDGNDNLTQVQYPCLVVGCTPRSVTYQYNAEGRLINVLNNGAAFASNFTYDEAARLATYQTGAATHRFDYDTRDRVSRVRAGPASGNALDLTYDYNKVSQVLGIADPRVGMSQTFEYDNLDRLKKATAGAWGSISWTYDHAGNRLTEDSGATTAYSYHPSTNRLTSTTGVNPDTFTYTAVGEVASDSQGAYIYSPAGMLLSATRPGMSAAYLYDSDLLRVKKVVNNTAVLTVRGIGGEVLSELRSRCGNQLEWVRDSVYAGGKLLGAVRNGAPPHQVEFVWPETGIDEGFGGFGMGVRITTGDGQPLSCPVTVSYEFVSGSFGCSNCAATPNSDYTATNSTLTFPAGTASGGYVGIGSTPVNDAVDEDSETYKVRLTGAVGAVLGTQQEHRIIIYDNDPTPSLIVNNITVSETVGVATFTVTLSAASARAISVNYTTVANETAVAGSDFYTASGTLTFQPGQTVAQIPVTIVNDTTPEPPETFTVSFSNAVNVTGPAGIVRATINSDEVSVPINPAFPGQYFSDVESSASEAGYILIYNPHASAVDARLTFTRSDGTGSSQLVGIPAQRRVTYDLAAQAVGGTGRFSVAVQTTDASKPLVSEHSGYRAAFVAGRNDGGSVPAPVWYFGEGAANGFFDETITIFNPTNTPVRVTINLILPNAAPLLLTPLIPTGPGRVELRVNDYFPTLGDHGLIVSGTIEGTSTPANIAVQRTMQWPIGSITESSTSSGASAPGLNWYFGEGGKGAWSTFLSFMNPSATQTAQVSMFYLHDNGQAYIETLAIPPQRRVTVSPAAGMPDGGYAIHAGSSNMVPYVVERSMYTGASFAVGGTSTPASAPAGTWRFAEGASNGYFDTYFSIFNPSFTAASSVTMTFRKEDNTVATHSFSVPPRQRWLVSPDGLPSVNGTNYATEVTTTNGVAIVVERAMYWPQGGWNASHLSMGRPQ
jgi:YD repeat-containing protein